MRLLLEKNADPASANTKAHALRAVLESKDEFSTSAAFMLLAHGADIDAATEEVSEQRYSAASMYANTYLFVKRWHGIALNALSERVEVDRRVGLGLHGLYQEALERVLQYLGLSIWHGCRSSGEPQLGCRRTTRAAAQLRPQRRLLVTAELELNVYCREREGLVHLSKRKVVCLDPVTGNRRP
jgi:hypothetical protein